MPRRRDPEDLHEWVSFDDPAERRTWVADMTFLLSSWTCIYGRGCKGVLPGDAAALEQGCCSHGAHFVDADDMADVIAAVDRLDEDTWQFHGLGTAEGYLETDEEDVTTTAIVDGACILLNRPGFRGGAGCALHLAATRCGERPLDWKPDVCWQLPLRLDEHTDVYGHVTSTLREWKRRDWGDGGEEFHWWCTEDDDAFIGGTPVFRSLADEIVEMIGETAFAILTEQLRRRISAPTPLPHPAVRRPR